MGKEVHITEQHAQFILDRLKDSIDNLEKTRQEYERMQKLDYIGGGFGKLQDGEDRKRIVQEAGATVLKWLDDLIDRMKKTRKDRKATFDALWGADWDSKQGIDQVQDQIQQAGH